METALEKISERVRQLKKRRPGYGDILDFYLKVRQVQFQSKAWVHVDPIAPNKGRPGLQGTENRSLTGKEDFPLDIDASMRTFVALCRMATTANQHIAGQVRKIDSALENSRLDLAEIFKGGATEQETTRVADRLRLDKTVFSFLIGSSSRPSIEAGVEQLRGELDAEICLGNHCPACGSPPLLSLLKGEGGKRYLLCSHCAYQWRTVRVSCPACGNTEQDFLKYFCAEEEDAWRIDLCDRCHHYIKTIDGRTLDTFDPCLEDLATLHLDILASQKGYARAAPNPWIAWTGSD